MLSTTELNREIDIFKLHDVKNLRKYKNKLASYKRSVTAYESTGLGGPDLYRLCCESVSVMQQVLDHFNRNF